MRPLKNRAPSGDVVVIGASQLRSFCTRHSGSSPGSLSRRDVGSVRRDTAGTSRADRSTNTLVVVNAPRHHPSHLRVVRAGIPVARRSARAAEITSAITLATITAAPR